MPRFLGDFIPALIKPTLKRRGFLSPRILLEWEQIVGPQLSQECCPDRVTFPKGQKVNGTVYLIVDPKSAFRFDYMKDLILEKINTYFGYGAVCHIKIFQKPLPGKKVSALPPKPLQAQPITFPSTGHKRVDEALHSYGSHLQR